MGKSETHFDAPSWDIPVTGQEALAELERLLTDPEFQSTERNKKFLRFVTEELFHGHENAVKAYSIAVDVFGRPSSFDPATDPIVRIEATRLRASLTRYYELHGREGGVRIDLPKGRYIPTFARLAQSGGRVRDLPAAAESRLDDQPALRLVGRSRVWSIWRAKWTAIPLGVLGGVALGTFLAIGAFNQAAQKVISEKPSVQIQMKLAGNEFDGDALRLRDDLMVALSQFQTLRVASAELLQAGKIDGIHTASASGTRQNSYHVILKYSADENVRSVWWQVIDPADGEALSSGTERAFVNMTGKSDFDETLVSQLATRFAAGRGVINSIETAREMANPTIGSGCVLRAYLAFERPDSEILKTARTCLEETLALRPSDPDANAALAGVLLSIDPPDAPTKLSQDALRLANRSVDLAPYSDRSAAAQMAALFRMGQIEAAVMAGRRGMQINPNNAAMPAKLGSILFTVGNWEEGIPLVIKAGQIEIAPQRDVEITLAMDAYRRGEYDEALLRLEQMGKTDCFCANVLRAATLGQLGRRQEAEAAAQALRDSREKFENSFRKDMETRHFAPVLIASLEAGLEKAGLFVKD